MEFGTVYTLWAFIIPSSLAAAIFVKEARHKPSTLASGKGAAGKLSGMTLPTIAVSQTFTVTADAVATPDFEEEKKYRFT